MSHSVEIQIATQTDDEMPDPALLTQWIQTALAERANAGEVCLRVVDEAEITSLNEQYRQKAGATNVLAFPSEAHGESLLGDVVICAAVVNEEAYDQEKSQYAHWAHIVVHGVLHLLGYDHHNDEEALVMEREEIIILEKLGIANPYQEV